MTARDVALIICGHAHTTDDAALLLDMLGLVDQGRLGIPQGPLLEVRNIRDIASTPGRFAWAKGVQR